MNLVAYLSAYYFWNDSILFEVWGDVSYSHNEEDVESWLYSTVENTEWGECVACAVIKNLEVRGFYEYWPGVRV